MNISPLNLADKYLQFIQRNFNVNKHSGNYGDIINLLNYFINRNNTLNKNDEDNSLKAEATVIRDGLKGSVIDPQYDKFQQIDFNPEHPSYQLIDEIRNDINKTLHWLDMYKQFLKKSGSLNNNTATHEELLTLGKSILGRATELCPKDTGYLRSSGRLIDYKDYITVGFFAPYATYVHENMEIRHPQHKNNPDCGGRAKFLEIALQEFFPDKRVWVEYSNSGDNGAVYVNISLNKDVEYIHYLG